MKKLMLGVLLFMLAPFAGGAYLNSTSSDLYTFDASAQTFSSDGDAD